MPVAGLRAARQFTEFSRGAEEQDGIRARIVHRRRALIPGESALLEDGNSG